MKNWMQKAREAAGLAPADCARALRLSVESYLTRENNPGMLTVDELVALSFVMDKKACKIIADGVRGSLL